MATFTAKILAQGQLPAAKGTLYTVPVLTKAYVKFINAHNVSGGAEAVFFYVKLSTGTSKILCRATLNINEQQRVIEKDETLNLGPGDTIEGNTTTATTVDYTITGVEESP
jgi:hypothetical protein